MQSEEFGHSNEKLFLKKQRNIQKQKGCYHCFTASGLILEIFIRQIENKYM